MRSARAAVACVALLVAAFALSGGSRADPATPPAIPGLPPPFLGTAVVGDGQTVGAVDSYGDVVDVRPLGRRGGRCCRSRPSSRPPGRSRPTPGSSRGRILAARRLPFWQADSVDQTLPARNQRAADRRPIRRPAPPPSSAVSAAPDPPPPTGAGCAVRDRWAEARRSGRGGCIARSLLVLRALTDRRTGATIAGARDGWAYVWPRDAATVAIALSAAGHRAEARRVVGFLEGLDLDAAARFEASGEPVDGRAAQGDAAGWVDAAARAVGIAVPAGASPWRGLADYQEKDPGDYLGNAIAAGARPGALRQFEGPRGLVRAGRLGLGPRRGGCLGDRPFRRQALIPAARTDPAEARR